MFETIARPFGILLMFLYELVHNYGLALLLVAVTVKVILLPFQMKGKRGMMRQSRLAPKIAELQKKHAANKQKLNEEMAKLYKEEGVNPASGCLWSFIQMPIMIALFYAIRSPLTLMMGVREDLLEEGGIILRTLREAGVTEVFDGFYSQVHIAQAVSAHWDRFVNLGIEGLRYIEFNIGIIDLARQPEWDFLWTTDWSNYLIWLPGFILFLFPFISGGAQFISASIMRKMNVAGSPENAAGAAGNIIKFMPLMSVWFGFILPAALSFYWTIGTILQIGQDIWLTKKYTKILDEEDAEKAVIREAREAELEAKRQETERKKAEGLAERNRNTSKRRKQKSNKQDKLEKAAEWEKKNAPPKSEEEKNEPGRVGNRRYARGRAYDPNRYKKKGRKSAAESTDYDEIEDIDTDEDIDDVEDYAAEDSGIIDVDYEDVEDEDDDEDFEDDEEDGYEDDDDDYEDDDEDFEDDDDDEDSSSSEKFETKRFD